MAARPTLGGKKRARGKILKPVVNVFFAVSLAVSMMPLPGYAATGNEGASGAPAVDLGLRSGDPNAVPDNALTLGDGQPIVNPDDGEYGTSVGYGDPNFATWTIHFDLNAPDADLEPIGDYYIQEDVDLVRIPAAPVREGYAFLGWSTQPAPAIEDMFNLDQSSDGDDAEAYGLFVPAEASLFNLTYRYVIDEDDEIIAVEGDGEYDSEGRPVLTSDLGEEAQDGTLTLYALWEKTSNEGAEEEKEETDGEGEPDGDAPDPPVTDEPVEGEEPAVEEESEEITDSVEAARAKALGSAYSDEAVAAINAEADAQAAALDKAVATHDNARGVINVLGLRVGGQEEPSFVSNEADGTRIGYVNIYWTTGDTPGSAYAPLYDDHENDLNASRLSLVPSGDVNQAMQFQVDIAISGEDDYEPGTIEFTLPAQIWKDANGKYIGYLTPSIPEEPDQGQDFAYRLVDGKYIITNVHRLDPALKASFQFSVRGITPHLVNDAVVPVKNDTDGQLKDIAGKTIAVKTASGYEKVDNPEALTPEQLASGDYYIIDNYVSDPIHPTLTVVTSKGTLIGQEANRTLDATIDTSERISSATKSSSVYEDAPSNLPQSLLDKLPEGKTKDDFVFVRWQTYIYHSGNQPFELKAVDSLVPSYVKDRSGNYILENGEKKEIEGIILGGIDPNGRAIFTVSDDRQSIQIDNIYKGYEADTTYLYDHLQYIWSAYPKEQFKQGEVYEFKNTVDWDLNGQVDKVVSSKEATSVGVYAPMPFIPPTGNFWMGKYTENSYKDYTYGYALDQLRKGNDVTVNFHLYGRGNIFPYTLPKGATEEDAKDINNYGKRDVHFDLVDDATWFNYDYNNQLTAEDFQFDSLRVAKPTQGNYGKLPNGDWAYTGTSANATPDVSVWINQNGTGEPRTTIGGDGSTIKRDVIEWGEQPYAIVKWDSAGSASVTYADGTVEGGNVVKFREKNVNNVTDYRCTFDSHAASVRLDVYPVLRLRSTDRIRAIVDNLYETMEQPFTKLRNDMSLQTSYPDTEEVLFTGADSSMATFTNTTLAISSDKSIRYDDRRVVDGGDNDTSKRRVTVHYTCRVHEQTNIESRAQYIAAQDDGIIPRETSGTWYDLLPLGVVPNTASVKLRSGDAVKDVRIEENWRGTGRIMLIVKADLSPTPTTYSGKYGDMPTLTFDAWYSWDSIKDLGPTLVNRVAFESGVTGTYGTTVVDSEFGNVKQHQGEKDDPTGTNGYMNNQTRSAVGEDAELLRDLDPDSDEGRFVYAKNAFNVTGDLSALTELSKHVMDDSKGIWTHGKAKDVAQVTVYPGHPYTYRLRVQAAPGTTTKSMIFYDSLEYYKPYGTHDAPDTGHQQWRGILRSVDTTELEEMGCAPVVYYSTKPNMEFALISGESADSAAARVTSGDWVISDTSIWTPASEYTGDMKDVTAIAVDARYRPNGREFKLEPQQGTSLYVHMVAPIDEDELYGGIDANGKDLADQDSVEDGGQFPSKDNPIFAAGENKYDPNNNRYAYNSTCLVCTEMQGDVVLNTNKPIDNPYTRVGILPFEVKVKKYWNDANNNDGKRPDSITLHLMADGEPAELTDGTEVPDIELNGTAEAGTRIGNITYNEDGTWTAKIEHVKAVSDEVNYTPLHYTIDEDAPSGYRYSVQEGNRNANGALINVDDNWFTIVNKHDKEQVSISGRKIWEDENDEHGARPESITVKLYADGVLKFTKTVGPGVDEKWSYSFGSLDKYKNGKAIVYMVTEDDVPKYVGTPVGDEQIAAGESQFSLVNTYHPLGNLAIQKRIVDATEKAAETEFTFKVLLTAEKTDPEADDQPLDGNYTYYLYEIDEDGAWAPIYELDDEGNPIMEDVIDLETGEAMVDPDTGETIQQPKQAGGTITSGATVTLKGSQKLEIVDLPSETTYEIVEDEAAGFTLSSSQNIAGIVRAGKTAEAVFENTYAAQGNVQLQAKKELKGHALARYQFAFRAAEATVDEDGAVTAGDDLRSMSCDADGTVTFGQIRYTQADDGKTYHYVIYEVNSGKPGYTYSAQRYHAVVKVTDNGDGTMTTETEYTPIDPETGLPLEDAESSADPPVFENEYHATGQIVLRAWKALPGRTLTDGEFTFELRDAETGKVLVIDSEVNADYEPGTNETIEVKELPDGTKKYIKHTTQIKANVADGAITFDPIVFDETDLMEVDPDTDEVTYLDKKEHLYTVNEVKGNDPAVIYDTSFKGYLVTVFDNGDGTLSVAQGNVDVSGLYSKCEACAGAGWVYCPICKGTGHTYLSIHRERDGGQGTTHAYRISDTNVVCGTCFSQGEIYDSANGVWVTCPDCLGLGSPILLGWRNSNPGEISITSHPWGAYGRVKGLNSPNQMLPESYSRAYLVLPTDNYFGKACANEHSYKAVSNAVICPDCEGAGLVRNPNWKMPESEASLPIFTNTLKPGYLSVTKLTDGSGNRDQEFTFRVELEGPSLPSTINYKITKTDGTASSSEDGDAGADGGKKALGGQDAQQQSAQQQDAQQKTDTTADAPQAAATQRGVRSMPNSVSSENAIDVLGSLIGVQKAYAASSDPAYAILDSSTGELIFFRSSTNYSNGTTHTVRIDGVSHRGTVYSGVENTGTGAPPWLSSNNDYNNNHNKTIKKVWVASGQMIKPKYCTNWFRHCDNLVSFNAAGFDTSETENMAFMFGQCSAIETLDLSSFNTSSLTVMNSMFNNCRKLTTLNIAGFDTSHVTNMGHLFTRCDSLETLNIANWDMSSVTHIDVAFSNCTALKSLDVSKWKLPNVKELHNMFYGCSKLTELDVSGWSVRNVQRMDDMFHGCSGLTELNLSSWSTPHATNMNSMFEGCSGIEKLNISGLDTSNLPGGKSKYGSINQYVGRETYAASGETYKMFTGMSSLKEVVLGPSFKFKSVESGAPASGLPDASSTSPYTGKWRNEEKPDLESETASQLMGNYNGATMSGTWIWETPPTSYILHFEKNNVGAGGSMGDQTVEDANEDATINPQNELGEFFEYGRHVTGWNTAADGQGDHSFECNGVIPAGTFPASYKPYTLYAQWADDDNSTPLVNGAFELTLRAGYTATLDPLPAGTAYRVYEQTPDGWILVSQVDAAGVIQPLQTANAIFTNSYQPAKAQAQLFATKTLDNRPAAEGAFTFELRDETGKIVEVGEDKTPQVKTNGSGGFVSFDMLTWTVDDLKDDEGNPVNSKEFKYTISEVVGDNPNISYDTHKQNVTVTVTKELQQVNDGSTYVMKATVSYEDVAAGSYPAFANTTKPGMLSLSKQTVNSTPASEDAKFEFTIKLSNANGMPLDANTVSYYKTPADEAVPAGGDEGGNGDEGGSDSGNQGGTEMGGESVDDEVPVLMRSAGAASVANAASAPMATGGTARALAAQANSTPFHVADLFGGDEAAAEEYLSTYPAYAVLDDAGKLVAFRSANTYEDGTEGGPFVDVKGNQYYGTIYAGFENLPQGVTYRPSWHSVRDSVISFEVAKDQAIRPRNISFMFVDHINLKSADMSRVDTSLANDAEYMFKECYSLETLNVSSMDTSNVTNMGFMFSHCKKVADIDVSGFDTSKVTNMDCMFLECSSVKSLDVSRWNTASLKNMRWMFQYCSNLESIDLSSFNTHAATTMEGLFNGCVSIMEVTLGEGFTFRGSNITATGKMALMPPLESTTPNYAGYTGEWERADKSYGPFTREKLRDEYADNASKWAGVWIRTLKEDAFTVILDTQGGVVENTTIIGTSSNAATLPLPDRPGYTFKGWNIKADGSGASYEEGRQVSFEAKSTTTLYAQWDYDRDVPYTVKYLVQEVANPSLYTVRETEQFTTRALTVTPAVKEFENLIPIDEPQTVDVALDGSTVVEYRYNRKHYTVVLKANGGEGDDIALAGASGLAQQLPANTFTKEGVTFVGWNTVAEPTEENPGVAYPDQATVKNLADDGGTFELYAQWAAVSDVEATDGLFKIKLKGGQTATFVGLPAGTTYEIVEVTPTNGWSQTGSGGDTTGAITSGGLASAWFKNTYSASGSTRLVAYKELIGSIPANGQFEFTLSDAEGNPIETVTNSVADTTKQVASEEDPTKLVDNPMYGTALVRFSDLSYTIEGAMEDFENNLCEYDAEKGTWTYTYTIAEKKGTEEFINYDGAAAPVTATVVLTDDGKGHLNADVSYEGGAPDRTASIDGNLFVNTLKPGTLSIEKTVAGMGDSTSSVLFDFTVTLTDSEDNPLADQEFDVAGTNEQRVIKTDENGVATLKIGDGEIAAISGIPSGTKYTVTEAEAPGFANTSRSGDTGVVPGNGSASASFENTYSAEGSVVLKANKIFVGRELLEGAFTFELRDEGGEVLQAVNNGYDLDGNGEIIGADEIGAVVFAPLPFTQSDSGKTMRFTINEHNAKDPTIEYDTHYAQIDVTVTDNGNGTLTIDEKYLDKGEKAEFVNGPASAKLSISKTVEGLPEGAENKSFEFTVTFKDADGAPRAGLELPVSGTYEQESVTTGKDGTAVLLIEGGETAVISGIPAETTYTVVETPLEGYELTEATGAEGTLGVNGNAQAAFVNTKMALRPLFRSVDETGYAPSVVRASAYPEVYKAARTENGSAAMITPGEFTFELHEGADPAKGELIATAANDASGTVAFFDENNLGDWGLVYDEPGTWTYSIVEVPGNDSTVTYDRSVIVLTVTVSRSDSADPSSPLKAELVYADGDGNVLERPTFENVREGMDLVVYKVSRFGGEGLVDCTYALWMAGPAGSGDVMVKEATSDATGRIVFTDVALLPGQKYYFKEVEAPSGHTVDPYRTAYFSLNDTLDGTVLVEDVAADGWHSKYDNIDLDRQRSTGEGGGDE